MDLREVGCDPGDLIDHAEDRDQWRAYVRAVMNLHNRDICHTVGPTFVSCVVEICRLGLEPL